MYGFDIRGQKRICSTMCLEQGWESAELLLLYADKSALDIFGSPDNLKLQSSLTLFAFAAGNRCVFERLLYQFYAGSYDINTIEMLKQINDQQYK